MVHPCTGTKMAVAFYYPIDPNGRAKMTDIVNKVYSESIDERVSFRGGGGVTSSQPLPFSKGKALCTLIYRFSQG